MVLDSPLNNFKKIRIERGFATQETDGLRPARIKKLSYRFEVFKADRSTSVQLHFLLGETMRTLQIARICQHYARHCVSKDCPYRSGFKMLGQ